MLLSRSPPHTPVKLTCMAKSNSDSSTLRQDQPELTFPKRKGWSVAINLEFGLAPTNKSSLNLHWTALEPQSNLQQQISMKVYTTMEAKYLHSTILRKLGFAGFVVNRNIETKVFIYFGNLISFYGGKNRVTEIFVKA